MVKWGFARFMALAVVLALVAIGCGDSGSAFDDATSTTSGSGSNGDDFTTIGTIGNIPGLSSECEALAEFMLGMSQALVGGAANAQALLASAADDLPSSLQGDLDTIANAAVEFQDVLDDLGIDPGDPTSFAALDPEQQVQYSQAVEVFSAPDVDAAFDNLNEFGEQECSNAFDFGS